MTSNKEDYLKILYEEGALDRSVANKVLADKLGVTPASVSEMLLKLHKEGLIVNESYRGTRLTEQGFRACIGVVRSHRLWEVFLMRHLAYSWREAHEDAHLLEHIAPARLVDRLDAFLQHPQQCPHGAFIPQQGKPVAAPQARRLSDLVVGDAARIVRVTEDGTLLDYLEKCGIVLPSAVRILSIDDYEGPVTFRQGGREITISFKAATKIFVDAERDPEKEFHYESDSLDTTA